MSKRKSKKASPGMWLTNGEIFCKEVSPGEWDSVDNYREITEEEYRELTEPKEVAYP